MNAAGDGLRGRRPESVQRTTPGVGLCAVLAAGAASAALACTQGQPAPASQDSGAGEAALFAPAEVSAWGGGRVEVLFVRPDDVVQLRVPVRPPAAGAVGTGRASRDAVRDAVQYTVGADSAEAYRYTGADAHVILRPAGAVDTRRELLLRETAVEGHVTVRPVWRLRADEPVAVLESVTVTVDRLCFPSAGPLRRDIVSRPVYAYPP